MGVLIEMEQELSDLKQNLLKLEKELFVLKENRIKRIRVLKSKKAGGNSWKYSEGAVRDSSCLSCWNKNMDESRKEEMKLKSKIIQTLDQTSQMINLIEKVIR